MAHQSMLAFCVYLLIALYSPPAFADVVRHTFHVGNHTVRPLCKDQVIVAVNNQFPGPILNVTEGDTVVVDVYNDSPYNITIHWHGVFQKFTAWADGPAYATQCPIMPGNKYTYQFNIIGQEGTLWWHAHFSMLRATVYGGLIIRPRVGLTWPFIRPYVEVPIFLGEWWNANVVDVENQAVAIGAGPNISDAYTINGMPGRLYSCSNDTFKLNVVRGQTYQLRIINAALNNQLFFKIAGHRLTVVAADAAYTNHYSTDVVVIAPGQTTDVLLQANQAAGVYYMAAHPYLSAPLTANNSTTTGIVVYNDAPNPNAEPIMPTLLAFNDTPTAHRFYTSLTSYSIPGFRKIYPIAPVTVQETMFIAFGLNLNRLRLAASMNNISFQLPTSISMLEAHYNNVAGVFTEDFPDNPPVVFDFSNPTAAAAFLSSEVGTRVKRLAFGTTVEVVLQNTAVLAAESHPMHLHGYNFYVVGQGFGNFNRSRDQRNFNLVNPQERNTIAVPVGGWAVIRFYANNPGVWLIHCHLDSHFPLGLATAFVVDDGPGPFQKLPPPPRDLPRC